MALKIITYNICEGGEDRIPQIEAVIAREEPHLVALTEANSRRKVRDLARSLDMEHFVGSARSGFHVAWLYCLPTRMTSTTMLPTYSTIPTVSRMTPGTVSNERLTDKDDT